MNMDFFQKKRNYIIAGILTSTIVAPTQAALVNAAYFKSTLDELNQLYGSVTRATFYVDQNACNRIPPPQDLAESCGTSTIAIGSQFLQTQENRYGDFTGKFILAHEWGHNIQVALNRIPGLPKKELQADCFAGNYVAYAERVLRYPSFLGNAIASVRDASDKPGQIDHGTPSERDFAVRYGYANGYNACLNT